MSMWFLIHPSGQDSGDDEVRLITYVSVVALAVDHRLPGVSISSTPPASRVRLQPGADGRERSCVYVGGVLLERQYRRHLTIATLLGLPEVSENRPSTAADGGDLQQDPTPSISRTHVRDFWQPPCWSTTWRSICSCLATVPVLYFTVYGSRSASWWSDSVKPMSSTCAEVPRFLPRFHLTRAGTPRYDVGKPWKTSVAGPGSSLRSFVVVTQGAAAPVSRQEER